MILNLTDLNRATIEYRANLDYLSEANQELYLLLNRNQNYLYSNLEYYIPRRGRVITAGGSNSIIKELQTILFFNFKLKDLLSKTLNEKSNYFKSSLNSLKVDYKKVFDKFQATVIKAKENYSKVIRKSSFEERGFQDIESLNDKKTQSQFLRSYQAEYKNGCIESSYRQVEIILPYRCSLLNRSRSDTITDRVENISLDADYLFRKDKKFHYVISKKQVKKNNAQVSDLEVFLEIEFLFSRYETFNQIAIDLGSSLPVVVENDDLSYFDKDTMSYKPIVPLYTRDFFNKKEVYLNEVTTNSFKIKLTQRKSYSDISIAGEGNVNILLQETDAVEQDESVDEIIKIFDLSVDHIEFLYKTYKQKSFFRDAEYTSSTGLTSVELRVNQIEADENCFIEKQLELLVYKEGNLSEKHFVPIPENDKVKEALVIKRKRATLTFPIVRSPLQLVVKKNGQALDPANYVLETEGTGGSSDSFYSSEIILANAVTQNVEDVFVVEYSANLPARYSKDILVDVDSLLIEYQNKKNAYSFAPTFIFRNKSNYNRSNMIKDYTILLLEADSGEQNTAVDFRRLKTPVAGETSNV